MRVLWLTAVMTLGSVSCLVAEDKSGVKYGDGNPGEDNAASKKSFISNWCGGSPPDYPYSGPVRRRYSSDGVNERTGQVVDIHIINHDNSGLIESSQRRISGKWLMARQ